MKKILILGASGFIGRALYKELYPYYSTYGTYHNGSIQSSNRQFHYFNLENLNINTLLTLIRPTHIISTLRGDFEAQIKTHIDLINYCKTSNSNIIFLSSSNVFDAFSNFPSYEYDKTLSISTYGKFKIQIETLIMQLQETQYSIVRLPMVFGNASPRIKELKYCIDNNKPYEVFPDLVMNVTSIKKLTQQLHYIINQNKTGIYHSGSTDLVHHDEFIKLVIRRLNYQQPTFKNVYTSNFNRHLAVLPKMNKLPENLLFDFYDILGELENSH